MVAAGAGESWGSLVEECVGEGLCGIECLIGIPGLVGATPVQNVGAYGQEVAQTIADVHVWDRDARLRCASSLRVIVISAIVKALSRERRAM